jgi:hypothetical protein
VRKNASQNAPVCTSDQSSENVVLIAGRSFCEISPVRETISHSASDAAIETAGIRRSASRSARERPRASPAPTAPTADAASP